MQNKSILIFIGSLKFGGAERVAARLANSFDEGGYEVTVVIYKNIINYDLNAGVKLVLLDIEKYKNQYLKLLLTYCKLLATVFRIKPDRAMAFTRMSSVILSSTLYPNVTGRLDIYPFRLSLFKRLSAMITLNLPNVRKVVSPSSELADAVRPYFIDKRKCITIPNPVNETIVDQALLPVDLPTKRKYLVSVGRLNHVKNPLLTLSAYYESALTDDWDLVFIGAGPSLELLRQQSVKYRIQDRVHFPGFLSNPFPVVANARFFISSSNWEGFPNAHIEALKLGVPVISTDCLTGPKEIVTHGSNGLLFPTNDKPALIAIFNDIARDPAILDSFREQARSSVDHLEISRIITRWREEVVY